MSDRRQPIAMSREEAARRRVASALRDIEDAQNKLANACAALGSLYDVGPESRKLMLLHEKVKGVWYQLHRSAEKKLGKSILLDHEPDGYESQWGSLPSVATTTATTPGAK